MAIEVPDANLLGVVEERLPEPSADTAALVREAFNRPAGSAPLAELAREAHTACVVIPDVTRPVPLRLVLPELLAELEAGGLERGHILLLIATGLHRSNEGAELNEMLGAQLVNACRIGNHRALDTDAHVNLGTTRNGAPALVDARLVEADLRITVGLTEPHFMAGFSGGRKLVCPGVCAEETIRWFHGYEILSAPETRNLNLARNPVHEMSTEIAEMAGIHFSLNVVMDSKKTVRSAHAGALGPAFDAACAAAKELVTVDIPRPADIVVVTGGGYPLDATWYQSIKGLVAAEGAVREGGIIIQATGLSEGVGSADFADLYAHTDSIEAFLKSLREPGFYRREQWQLQLFARVARKARVMVCSHNVPAAMSSQWFVEPVPSVEEGIERALADLGADASILLMPHGPYVIPVTS